MYLLHKFKQKKILCDITPWKIGDEVCGAPIGRTRRKRGEVKSQPYNAPSKSNLSLKLFLSYIHTILQLKLHSEIVQKKIEEKEKKFLMRCP